MQCSNGHEVDGSQKFCSECGDLLTQAKTSSETPDTVYTARASLSSANADSQSLDIGVTFNRIEKTGAEKFWYVLQNVYFGSGYLAKVPVKKALSEAGLCVMTTAEKVWYVTLWLGFGAGYFHKVIIKKALNEAELVQRTSAEQFWYVLLCIFFGAGYFGKLPMKKALEEYQTVRLTDAEQFWYIVENIGFGSGYFAKMPIEKALSESSLDGTISRPFPIQKTPTAAMVLIPFAILLIVVGLPAAIFISARPVNTALATTSATALSGPTGASGSTGVSGATGNAGTASTTNNFGTLSSKCASSAFNVAGFSFVTCASPAGTWGKSPTVVVPTTPAPTNLEVADLINGTGATLQLGDKITAQYVLADYASHTILQSSWTSGAFSTTFAKGSLIPGWIDGLAGMKVGGRREIVIPPSLAYGASGQSPIPGNDTLVFIVDLLKIG